MQKLNPNIIKNLYDYVIHDQQSFDDAFEDNGGGEFQYKTGIKNIYFATTDDYTVGNLTGMTSIIINEVTECFVEPNITIDSVDIFSSDLPIPKNTNPLKAKQAIELLEIDGDVIDVTPKYIISIGSDYEVSEFPSIINTDSDLLSVSDYEVVSTPAIIGYINNLIVTDWNNEDTSKIAISTNALNQPQNNIDIFGFVFSEDTSILQTIYDMYGNLNIRKYDGTTWTNWYNPIQDKYIENYNNNLTQRKYGYTEEIINSFNETLSITNSTTWYSVCWSPELAIFVSVSGTSYIQYSYDGINWTAVNTGYSIIWSSVAWSSELSLFVAVAFSGTNRVMYSSDGINWTATTSGNESNNWVSICWSSELHMFVSVSNSGTNRVQYSYDGTTWTAVSSADDSNTWYSVCWSPELYMFVSVADTGTNRVQYSYDGINWIAVASGAESNEWKEVAWSPELMMFVSVASSGTNRVMYSYDGINWTAVASTNESNAWRSVAWSPKLSIFVAVAYSGVNRIMYSYDGINWNETLSTNDNNGFTSICWSPKLSMFIVVSSNGSKKIAYLKG